VKQPPPLDLLLPSPKKATALPALCFGEVKANESDPSLHKLPAYDRVLGLLKRYSIESAPALSLRFVRDASLAPEAYKLTASAAIIEVSSSTPAGSRYALSTLQQWLELNGPQGSLPGLAVEDEPDLAQRGVMLDISRDRVPSMATAFALVELLSSWKINQLQLYTEHTFAYSGAAAVWGDSSPWTAEEIRALDSHAELHGIELVPNQQSFGHLHRWLVHSPYNQLAEVPEGVVHPFHPTKQPFSICPTDETSLQFLASLYDELLPNFKSQRVNVGLDETFDLGLGKSKTEVEARGVAEVYMDFLQGVHGLIEERGHKMQFWADIILNHPETLERLPQDCESVLWGYEADHPLDAEAKILKDSGVDYLIAPGTSSWQSFGGRTNNCIANLRSASRAARAHSAGGLLITDWGDRGHIQPLPISYLGFLHGAEAAWNGAAAELRSDEELAALLDHHAFKDPEAGLGEFALALGRASDPCNVTAHNVAALFFPIGFPEESLPLERAPGLTHEAFQAGKSALESLHKQRSSLAPRSPEAQLAFSELSLALDLLSCSCELGILRSQQPVGAPIHALPSELTAEIAVELRALGERHADLWLVRSRPGGLVDSVARLHGLADILQADHPPESS
jgi:hexosaminidase